MDYRAASKELNKFLNTYQNVASIASMLDQLEIDLNSAKEAKAAAQKWRAEAEDTKDEIRDLKGELEEVTGKLVSANKDLENAKENAEKVYRHHLKKLMDSARDEVEASMQPLKAEHAQWVEKLQARKDEVNRYASAARQQAEDYAKAKDQIDKLRKKLGD